LFAQRFSEFPTDENEFENLRQHNVALRESSIKLTGCPLIDYMDTTTIARDHEVVRSALGNENLSWLGQSGGTQLGERYAELYPNNIRAMVLDAVVAQSQYGLPGFIENALSEDATMKQFFRWCEQQNATVCPAAHHNKTIEAVWTDLLARAEASPLPAPKCTPEICVNDNVTAQEFRNAARNALYKPFNTESGFATLAAGIYQAAFLDDASVAAVRVPSNSSPPYTTAFNYATNVIECNDRINDDTIASMQAKALEAESSTPLFSGITVETAFESACIGWPTLPRNPPHAVDIPHNTTLPVILMVSNLYDPATPYSWGTKVQQEIGDSRTRRVTRIAAGHTVYFQPEAYDGETVHVMVRESAPELSCAVTD
jgi:pimeloyl-ACP methyl ester carboxylesterase